jgi:hypothetical protein
MARQLYNRQPQNKVRDLDMCRLNRVLLALVRTAMEQMTNNKIRKFLLQRLTLASIMQDSNILGIGAKERKWDLY